MDRKTLEYMEERAKKARGIVNRIEKLKKDAAKSQRADRFIFDAYQHGSYVETKDLHLLEKMKIAFEKAVVEEIEKLEQELAKL
ncbi:hypothetical protein J1P26_17385 [Neobacillus sp. MM2021_6]|uniref:hypothetical protein n=1 Tax=Bacillaceae TaxID=186817 RepID=UPI00140A5738|nr:MULTISPECIES: hypothetical protein [Bacillaceae]MBO0961482.1 hypothetical protein [Neobacillus sp. MM2021_6]NHC19586.1 hypothetical protein [Bacillus sp. MM2020_4]